MLAPSLKNPWGPVPAPPFGHTWEALMQQALHIAQEGGKTGEVPVGALCVRMEDGVILGAASNASIRLCDPTAHAEILALRKAAKKCGNYRLQGCVLVVTLEPCPMCLSAIREARVDGIVYAAAEKNTGALGSAMDGLTLPYQHPAPWVMGGLMAEQSTALLQAFFLSRR